MKTVWTVFIELDGDDTGYVHGLYATEALARAAGKAEYDERIARGDVPWVPEGAAEGECNEDWDFDIIIREDAIIGAPDDVAGQVLTRAEIVNGTGFSRGARFQVLR